MEQPDLDDAWIDATASILSRRGLPGLSLSSIAEEAGVSRVTLHRRDVDLASLVRATVTRAGEDLRASLWNALTAPGDASTRLRAALTTLCDVVERHAGVLSALFHTPDHARRGGGQAPGFDFIDPFERLLRDGELDGSLTTAEAESDAELLANAVTWTYLHMRRSHGWPADHAASAAIDMAMARHLTRR